MPRLPDRNAYSYRDDPAITGFDDDGPVLVMDGDCALCSAGARARSRLDKATEVRICRAQSARGRALLEHYPLAPPDPDGWLCLMEGRAHTSLDAMISLGGRMGGLGYLLQPLLLIPRPAQDWLYQRLARNRYARFGRGDICAIPDPRLRAGLLE